MDLENLERDLEELQSRRREWVKPIIAAEQETRRKLRDDRTYTKAEQERDIRRIYLHQLSIYNPRQAQFPIRETVLEFFVGATPEERTLMRNIVYRVKYGAQMMLSYMWNCAECMESPEDGWILHSGLVAAAIENFGWGDFRDTHAALAELAVSAREAGIDIEPISQSVVELCAPTRPNSFSMRREIEKLHIYARTAKRLFDED